MGEPPSEKERQLKYGRGLGGDVCVCSPVKVCRNSGNCDSERPSMSIRF